MHALGGRSEVAELSLYICVYTILIYVKCMPWVAGDEVVEVSFAAARDCGVSLIILENDK